MTSHKRIRLTRLGRHRPGVKDTLEVSCGVLDIMDGSTVIHRVVVDCGMSPQRGTDTIADISPDFSLFDDGKRIDAFCGTHMHLDHIGGLPMLSPFMAEDAPVFLTRTSAQMFSTVFNDSLKIQKQIEGPKPFSAADVEDMKKRIVEIDKPGEIEVVSGVPMYVHPAGHMPGACSFTMRLGKVHVHYAGDRCEHNQAGTLGATLTPAEWRTNCIGAGCDCTYGNDPSSDTRNRQHELERALAMAARAMGKGAPALFCTFATRGAPLAAELQAMNLPNLGHVYLDGSIREYAGIVGDPANHWSDRDSVPLIDRIMPIRPMTWKEMRGEEEVEGGKKERATPQKHREGIVQRGGGYAVISTPGMLGPNGASTFWREHVLENRDAALILTGYVAPDSDAALLLEAIARRDRGGDSRVTFMETEGYDEDRRIVPKTYVVRCNVVQCRIGAHDSRQKTLEWFERMQFMATVLNHGSPAALESLEASLRSMHGLQEIHPCHQRASVEFDI